METLEIILIAVGAGMLLTHISVSSVYDLLREF